MPRAGLSISRSTAREGDLSTGRGMGMDSAGDLYVTDTVNDQIARMDKRLRPIVSFGGRGSGPGRFRGITDVAVGPGLTDTGASAEVVYARGKTGYQNTTRLVTFTTDGRPIGVMGENLNLHYGQLDVDPLSHHGIVCDATLPGSIIFDQTGRIISKIGSNGQGRGQFNGVPRGIDVYRHRISFTDSDNRRIQVFDTAGNFIFLFGSEGTGFGHCVGRKGIAVNDGTSLVCDLHGYGLDEFDLAGTPLRSLYGDPRQVGGTGDRGTPGALTFATDVRGQTTSGLAYVAHRESNDIEVVNPDGISYHGAFSGAKDLHHPVGLAFTPVGDLVVTDSPNRRIVRSTLSSSGTGTLTKVDPATSIGGLELCSGIDVAPRRHDLGHRGPRGQPTPARRAMDPLHPGRRQRAALLPGLGVRVGPDGLLVESTPGTPYGAVPLSNPEGLALGPDGLLYVADTDNDRVIALSAVTGR